MIPRFRVFDKVENLMIYTYEDVKYDYGTGSFNSRDNILYETEHYPVSYLSMFFMFLEQMKDTDQLVLMQSTGLFDKNGVEIYEGDVLSHSLQGRREVFYPYSENVASYGLRNIDNGFGSTLQDSHAVWEVIGNVHENPELLEVEE